MFFTTASLTALGFYLLMCLATVLYWAVLSIGDGRRGTLRPALDCRVHKASRANSRERCFSSEDRDSAQT